MFVFILWFFISCSSVSTIRSGVDGCPPRRHDKLHSDRQATTTRLWFLSSSSSSISCPCCLTFKTHKTGVVIPAVWSISVHTLNKYLAPVFPALLYQESASKHTVSFFPPIPILKRHGGAQEMPLLGLNPRLRPFHRARPVPLPLEPPGPGY